MFEKGLPGYVDTALDILEGGGFEACLVGGCVRDALLGREPHDYDIATNAMPEQTERLFSSYRTFEAGKRFGTVGAVIDGRKIEITTYRAEGGYEDRRHPGEVRFGVSLEDDLARRDITVNAMAWSRRGGMTDPFGGREDLEKGVIRCVGDPVVRFSEDALRILRVIRFSGRLGFSAEESTLRAMEQMKDGLEHISKERIRDELRGMLLCGRPSAPVGLALRLAGRYVLPCMVPCVEQAGGAGDCGGVLERSLRALDAAPEDLEVRLAVLLCDAAKPLTAKTGRDGALRFCGHAAAGAVLARRELFELRFDNASVQRVSRLIEWHCAALPDEARGVRRMYMHLGEELFRLLEVMRSFASADGVGGAAQTERISRISSTLEGIISAGDCVSLKTLAVGGDDMLALGFKGEQIGRILNSLLDRVADDPSLNRRGELLAAAEAMGKARGGGV